MGENYRPKPLVPITSPIALREATVRDYRASHERMGVKLDSALLEKLAVSDLELVDASRRGLDYSPSYQSKPKPKKPNAGELATKALGAESGLELKFRKPTTQLKAPQGWLNMPADQVDEKWGFMMGRLKRITEGASATPDMMVSISTTEMPDLSLEIRRITSDYMLRHRRSKHNRFLTATGGSLSDLDAFRKFRRLLENICDASSGRMGPWWVPK